MSTPPDPRKLAWRCRRGTREMDLLLSHYLNARYAAASAAEQKSFAELLEENDLDIFSWITQTTTPDEKYADVVARIRELQNG